MLLHYRTLIILVLNPLFSWHIEIESMVNCSLHINQINMNKTKKKSHIGGGAAGKSPQVGILST